MSNIQRENVNAIFRSEKLDKSDELTDALKDLTINDAKYYKSDTATAGNAKGDPTRDLKTVTHIRNGNEKVTDTSNGNFEQKLLSNRTLPVVAPTMNPRIDHMIELIVVAPQTVLTPAMKEVVADTASGGAWVNMTPRKVIRTGIDGSTPCDMGHVVSIEHDPSPVMIGIVSTYPPCGLNGILQVAKERKSTSPGLGGNTQKLDAVIDGNFPNDLDPASIFSKIMGHKISDGSSDDLYSRCKMNFAGDVVQTQAPQFMDLGFLDINTLNEIGVIGTPAARIRRPMYGSHWSAPNHVFGEATVVGMSAAKSDHDYNYKTDFEIWRQNQEF